MTDSSLLHHSFTLERRYPVPAQDVFTAWSDPSAKRRWFTSDRGEHELDFRVGGTDVVRARGDNGKLLVFEARYLDIIEGRRILQASTLSADGELATTSITSVEFYDEDGTTVLVLTESDVFSDGQEEPSWREAGTADQLEGLAAELQTTRR